MTTDQGQLMEKITELIDEAERAHPDCPGPLDLELRIRRTDTGWRLINTEISCYLPPLLAA